MQSLSLLYLFPNFTSFIFSESTKMDQCLSMFIYLEKEKGVLGDVGLIMFLSFKDTSSLEDNLIKFIMCMDWGLF